MTQKHKLYISETYLNRGQFSSFYCGDQELKTVSQYKISGPCF